MDYHIPIKQLVDWFQADIVSRKRYEIQQLLHSLMEEQNIDIEALNLPVLSLKPGGYSDENEMVDDEDPGCENQEDEDMMEDDYPDPENELEDGEYGHPEEEDEEEEYMHDDDLEHEMDEDEDEFGMHSEDEMSDNEIGEEDKELDEISSLHGGTGKRKVDLKQYRIPRLRKDMNDDV